MLDSIRRNQSDLAEGDYRGCDRGRGDGGVRDRSDIFEHVVPYDNSDL